ncbi:hypothetical protein HPS36_01995 [Halorubrum salinarum]|uniref:Ada DNA repair metal-binding domain-containing protein n=1 Tax=Halorubrum salinarum TaxID=2739057 RepID=A0A7D3XXK5_9EURY|nr:hypothetical protein [Halorubrum salinarum]QKG91674.1 hypothetical protein HPS36_01995 [Halorubrum salinarum]
MGLKLSQELYHEQNCDSPLMAVVPFNDSKTSDPDELEKMGYEPCPRCFPERSEAPAAKS